VKRKTWALLCLAVVLLAKSTPAFAQCAMCKTLLTNSPEGRAMTASFNSAILLMLAAPYLVAASLAFVLFRERILAGVRVRVRRAATSRP
jgi:hypothetical protein